MYSGRWILLCLSAIAIPAWTQTSTGEITGLITDSSGAVTPKAEIEVMNSGSGTRWKAVTNDSGYYTVPLLPPGDYAITVHMPGFKTTTRAGIKVEVAAVLRIDFKLELGAASETVQVTASAPLLESQSASLGQVVQTRVINDLPLNGRNYLQLAKLSAGVVEPQRDDNAAGSGSFSANGVRVQLNNFNLDGADNNTRIVDIQNNNYQVIQPSVDALEEFKVETSNYSAEYGYSAGAVVNATIKSGSNRFHGDAFEFLRNDHLDARDYFLAAGLAKQRHQRNQFGGVVGGPIVRNKIFLFGSWERTVENLGLAIVTTLPSAALRGGSFAGQKPIFDPTTTTPNPNGSGFVRTVFPGNLIPQSRISSVSAKLTSLLPAPNAAGAANNFVGSPSQSTRINRFDNRGDENISDKDKLFERFSYAPGVLLNPGPLPAPLIGATSNNQNLHTTDSHSAALGETHIFSASAVNEFRAGYSRIYDLRGDLVSGPYLGPQFGFLGIPANPGPGVSGLPTIGISGYSTLGEQSSVPNGKIAEVLQFRDSVSWVTGNHSFKAGGDFSWVRSYYALSSFSRGSYIFDGTFTQDPQNRGATGNGYADFLLGIASNASISGTAIGDARTKYTGAFLQDDWKITRRLTVNLGLRYELWTWRVERNNLQGNFAPSLGKVIYPENKVPPGIPASIVANVPSNLDSRSLLPTDTNNLAPRLGVAYQLTSHTVLRAGAGLFYASQAFPGAGATPLGSPPFLLINTYPTDQINPSITFANGFPADALNTTKNFNPASATWDGFDIGMKMPYVWKWNVGLQHEVAGILLEANYVGDKGSQLPVYYDYNMPLPGSGSVPSRRLLPAFGSIGYTQSMGNSEYEALEARVEKRFSAGLSMLASYTHSKVIDYGGVQLSGDDLNYRNVRNIALDRGPAAYDLRDRLVISYLYDLPFGRGRRFSIANPMLNTVLGNWQVNGITTIRGGQYFTAELGFSAANTGDPRPDRIRDGNLPSDQRTVQHWFDTAAFVAPTPFNFGNEGRDVLLGPGAVNFDFSFFKRLPLRWLGESGEAQFRSEFFNLFNHPQFQIPNTRADIPQGGSITATSTAMRQIQFGMKVIF
jgi:hypothetical protein